MTTDLIRQHLRNLWILLFALLSATTLYSQTDTPFEYLWYEAENMRGFSTGKLGEQQLNPSYLNLSREKAPGAECAQIVFAELVGIHGRHDRKRALPYRIAVGLA